MGALAGKLKAQSSAIPGTATVILNTTSAPRPRQTE